MPFVIGLSRVAGYLPNMTFNRTPACRGSFLPRAGGRVPVNSIVGLPARVYTP